MAYEHSSPLTPEQRELLSLGSLLVIDLEAPCWAPEASVVDTLRTGDVIEIGIAVADLVAGRVGQAEAVFVKPTKTDVSAYCTELTSIRPEDVASALSYRLACDYVRDKYGHLQTWGSWGRYDWAQFKRQCERENVQSPVPERHFNIKKVVGKLLRSTKGDQMGLRKAVETLGLTFEGRLHRGVDDAVMIARVLVECRKRFLGDTK